jgi:hypothetical protein
MWQMISGYDEANSQFVPLRWSGQYGCVGECRPRLVFFSDCEDVVVRGVQLRDSADWTQLYRRTINVSLEDLVVWGSQEWPNNDGVDFESCTGVLMRNVSSFTGDDGVVLASGNCNDMIAPWPEPWGSYTPTRDVLIENCTISSYSSAIKYEAIFQAWHGDVYNVMVRDVLIHDSARGIGFQQRTGGGAFFDAIFERVTVRRTKGINGNNWWGAGEALWLTTLPEEGPKTTANHSLGGLRNISFVDCVLEGEQGAVVLSRGQGNASAAGPAALTSLLFSNVSLVIGVYGNYTRPGVHDLRPVSTGPSPLEPSAEPQANCTGFWFEHADSVRVVGGSVAFVGAPPQPFSVGVAGVRALRLTVRSLAGAGPASGSRHAVWGDVALDEAARASARGDEAAVLLPLLDWTIALGAIARARRRAPRRALGSAPPEATAEPSADPVAEPSVALPPEALAPAEVDADAAARVQVIVGVAVQPAPEGEACEPEVVDR